MRRTVSSSPRHRSVSDSTIFLSSRLHVMSMEPSERRKRTIAWRLFPRIGLSSGVRLTVQSKSEDALRFNMGQCGDQRRTGMRHILIGVGLAAVAVALWPDFSDAQVASIPASSLTGSGVLAIEAGYNKRHRTTYTSRRCYNRDEIRELQRMWPETNWPKSMRCFRYR